MIVAGMILLGTPVMASALDEIPVQAPTELSARRARGAMLQVGTHPGRNGPLTAEQREMADTAWRYFETNTQPASCLVNSVAGYPSTTMWDTASALAAVVSAFELDLIDAAEFDERVDCMLEGVSQLPLFLNELPNKAYHTISMEAVNYANEPGYIGISALDMGRMLLWLAIVKHRYPLHADAIDRIVLGWSFCSVVGDKGALFGAAVGDDDQVTWLQEGRLGYEEYAAAGFQLWGFDTQAASDLEPKESVRLFGVSIDHDARDPADFGAHTYVLSEPYLLMGIELNWDEPSDGVSRDTRQTDRAQRTLARRVYRVQARRWRRTGVLTARTEHHVSGPPYFVYDTVYSDGVAWNTLTDAGHEVPERASVSTKAAVGMDVLFDTPYTTRLVAAVSDLRDPAVGLYEGMNEATGAPIEVATANTNGIVLESLLYQVQGKLYRGSSIGSLWDRVPNAQFPGDTQCLPGGTGQRADSATGG